MSRVESHLPEDKPRRQHDQQTDRAQAEQIDFLNGMILLLFGLGLFFASASVLFTIGAESNPDLEGTAQNADQRVVEDLLTDEPGTLVLAEACADAFFGMDEHDGCGLTSEWFNTSAPSELHWIRHAIGLSDDRYANVTVVDGEFAGENPSGGFDVVHGESGTEYAIGPTPPPGVAIAETSRFVAADEDEYYTVLVRVW